MQDTIACSIRYNNISFREISLEREEKLKKEEDERKKFEKEQRSLSVSSACKTKMFCESMSPTELAEWLLEDLGNDFADDINKLKSMYFITNNV